MTEGYPIEPEAPNPIWLSVECPLFAMTLSPYLLLRIHFH